VYIFSFESYFRGRRMKRIYLITLIVIAIAVSVVVGAYVYELVIPGDVVVIETPEGEYKLEAFEDAPCTVSLTYVDWGEMQSGELKQIDFWVKNTGSQTITGMIVEVDSDVQHTGGHGYGSLGPGQSLEVTATLMISPTATPGSYSANIKITCTA